MIRKQNLSFHLHPQQVPRCLQWKSCKSARSLDSIDRPHPGPTHEPGRASLPRCRDLPACERSQTGRIAEPKHRCARSGGSLGVAAATPYLVQGRKSRTLCFVKSLLHKREEPAPPSGKFKSAQPVRSYGFDALEGGAKSRCVKTSSTSRRVLPLLGGEGRGEGGPILSPPRPFHRTRRRTPSTRSA